VENGKERIEKLMVGTVTKILEIFMGIIHANQNNKIVINTRDHKEKNKNKFSVKTPSYPCHP